MARKHDVFPYDCWTDDGYELLAPLYLRHSAFGWNGLRQIRHRQRGFHQFFHNGTGVLRRRWWNGAIDLGLTMSQM